MKENEQLKPFCKIFTLSQTDYDEAYEHLKYVRLNKENAFLFREKDK